MLQLVFTVSIRKKNGNNLIKDIYDALFDTF